MPPERDIWTRLVSGAEQRFASCHVKERASIERVEIVVGGHRADEEVTGHADAFERHPRAATDLEADDRQRDGNTELAMQYPIQQGVARIVIVRSIACEAFFYEKAVNECLE